MIEVSEVIIVSVSHQLFEKVLRTMLWGIIDFFFLLVLKVLNVMFMLCGNVYVILKYFTMMMDGACEIQYSFWDTEFYLRQRGVSRPCKFKSNRIKNNKLDFYIYLLCLDHSLLLLLLFYQECVRKNKLWKVCLKNMLYSLGIMEIRWEWLFVSLT